MVIGRVFLSLLLLLCGSYLWATDASFKEQWQLMQKEYNKICAHMSESVSADEKQYVHPYWREQRKQLARIIEGTEDESFLQRAPVAGQMVRSGWGKTQEYECAYLNHCVSQATQNALSSFKDVEFGGSLRECAQFNCSVNALGQLFYTARLLELSKHKKIKTMVEFGGGYGCLARINKMVNPDLTYIIFDLPEYLALQSLFLRSTLPGVSVEVCAQKPTKLEEKTIYLIPVFYMPEMAIETDVFVSTFALSEAPMYVQKKVADLNFFNSSFIYIAGKLNKWGSFNFEHHSFIMQEVRSRHSLSMCHPFEGDITSYELFGIQLER